MNPATQSKRGVVEVNSLKLPHFVKLLLELRHCQ